MGHGRCLGLPKAAPPHAWSLSGRKPCSSRGKLKMAALPIASPWQLGCGHVSLAEESHSRAPDRVGTGATKK